MLIRNVWRVSPCFLWLMFSMTVTFEEVVTLLKLSGVGQRQYLDGKPGLEAAGGVREGNLFTWKVSSAFKIMLKKKLISAYRSAALLISCKREIHTWLLMMPLMGLEHLSAMSQCLHLIPVVWSQFCLSRICFRCICANFMHWLSEYSIAPTTVHDLFEMKSTFLHHSLSGYIWLWWGLSVWLLKHYIF